MANLDRESTTVTCTFAISSTLSPALDVRRFAGGALRIPTPWGGGTCSFKAASLAAPSTFQPVYDKAGARVQFVPTANGLHELHEALMSLHYLKVVKAIAVTGTRQIGLDLKA